MLINDRRKHDRDLIKLPNDTGILYVNKIVKHNGEYFIDGVEVTKSKTGSIFNYKFSTMELAENFLNEELKKIDVRLI